MTKHIFDVNGTIKVGDKSFNSDGDQVEVIIDGEIITSGCGDAVFARSIGVKNITMALDHDEVLENYTSDDLIDHIINSNRPDKDLINIYKALSGSIK